MAGGGVGSRGRRLRDSGGIAAEASSAQQRYLATAAQQLTGHPEPLYPFVLSHVRAAVIAEQLGCTRTALYRRWPSQSEMWDDLIVYLLLDEPPLVDLDPSAASPSSMLPAIQVHMRTSSAVALRTALLAYQRPQHLERLLVWKVLTRIEGLTHVVTRMLEAMDRVPQEPLTAHDLGMALFCVADGLAYVGRLTPRLNHRSVVVDGERAGLLAYAAEGLLARCTRRRQPTDPETVVAPVVVPAPARAEWTGPQLQALRVGASVFRSALDEGAAGGLPVSVGHLSMARVARSAGVSRQAVTGLWANQRAFSLDLMAHLHGLENRALLLGAERAIELGRRKDVDGPQLAAEFLLGRVQAHAQSTSFAHLAFVPHFGDPDVQAIGAREREFTIERFAHELRSSISAPHGDSRGSRISIWQRLS